MDVCTHFEKLVSEMEWGDVVATIEEVLLTEMKVDASLEEEALNGNTIWSNGVYSQEVVCHPGQVTHNLHSVKCS